VLVTTTGEHLGEHSGAEFYTIGQRHINADFKFPKAGAQERLPFYVASKDAATNTVVLAEGGTNDALYRSEVELAGVNFINDTPTQSEMAVFARVRYRQPVSRAALSRRENGNYALKFETPQKFVAPGQSAVWYSEDGEMLGGGVIL